MINGERGFARTRERDRDREGRSARAQRLWQVPTAASHAIAISLPLTLWQQRERARWRAILSVYYILSCLRLVNSAGWREKRRESERDRRVR